MFFLSSRQKGTAMSTPARPQTCFTFKVSDNVECYLGWDVMLETFFAQVYPVDSDGERVEEHEEKDATLCWVGTQKAAIRMVDQLAYEVRQTLPGFFIPKDIFQNLYEIEID